MPILESDVKFRASQRMTDFADGGGLMSSVTIVDGVDNNLFDDITDLQRLFGHLSLRKVYGAVLNNGDDTYLSAHVLVDVPPSDPATDAVVFAWGGLSAQRGVLNPSLAGLTATTPGSLVAALNVAYGTTSAPYGASGTDGSIDVLLNNANTAFIVGVTVSARRMLGAVPVYSNHTVTAVNVGGSANAIQVDPAMANGTGAAFSFQLSVLSLQTGYPVRFFGVSPAAGATASGSTTLRVESSMAQLVPADPSAYPELAPVSWNALDPRHFSFTAGRVFIFQGGDGVLIHSTISMAPAAAANGSTVTTGRTALSRLRVIGNNKVVHASFVANQPAPVGVGCTADLAAGTVTFSDVSGMSQPVTVEHRIEEMSVVSAIAGNTLTLNRPLGRAYPAGTRVSSLLMLGDLKARVGAAFAQNAWTGVWSDTVLGGAPAADYDIAGTPFVVTNQGAVNERWYCQFTNTTTFTLVGEQLGVIGTFGTGSACAPNNPATGVPYFTIPAVGWGSGWAAGNVFRFNTAGANAPIWVGRSVAPSTPSGDDSVTLQLRGYVNT